MGVMLGVISLLFLGAGVTRIKTTTDERDSTNRHFNEKQWRQSNLLLMHIKPTSVPALKSSTQTRCFDSHADSHQMVELSSQFQKQIDILSKGGFLSQKYHFDYKSWLNDEQMATQSCAGMANILHSWVQPRRGNENPPLENLLWRERQTKVPAPNNSNVPWVILPRAQLARRSPWSGVPGCIFLRDDASDKPVPLIYAAKTTATLCLESDFVGRKLSDKPVSAGAVPGMGQWASLVAPWLLPHDDVYQSWIGDSNRTKLQGHEQAIGLHAEFTFDPDLQSIAQTTADCFTGRGGDGCKDIENNAKGRFENARVRMAGIALVDVSSGRILAAGSSGSPCYDHDQHRRGQPPRRCPDVGNGNVHHPLIPVERTNHGLVTQAPPGSLVKPILMAGILMGGRGQGQILGLAEALKVSDSQLFIDALMCRQRLGSGRFSPQCDRPNMALESAHRLGWNSGCQNASAWGLQHCGQTDLLYGMAQSYVPPSVDGRLLEANLYRPIQQSILYGRLFVRPANSLNGAQGYQDFGREELLPEAERRQACAQSGRKGYFRCSDRKVAVISEAYGQGNARTTAVGVAGMISALAASEHNEKPRYPHILEGLYRSNGLKDRPSDHGKNEDLPMGPPGVSPEIAARVLEAMSTSHLPRGTSHSACVQVMGEAACNAPLGIAGKTGTPGDADDRSLKVMVAEQIERERCLANRRKDCFILYPPPRPRYRWYAAAFKSNASKFYDKTIAVLVHSNWRISDGRYVDDQNAAAEIAFNIINRIRLKSIPAVTNPSSP